MVTRFFLVLNCNSGPAACRANEQSFDFAFVLLLFDHVK
jgi:hypothetical protein